MDDFETAKRLFLEGLRSLEANNLQAAERQFTQSLQILPDRVSTLNNLSSVKIKLKKFAEAEELARKAVTLEDKSPEAWSNLGIALMATERPGEALQACDRAVICNSASANAWLSKATTLLELKIFEEALAACEQALKLDPSKYEISYTKSLILKELDRLAEAKKTYRQSVSLRVAASPVFIAERRATQKGEVLIINRNPNFDASFDSFDFLQRNCSNFPGQFAEHLHEDFHFNYVFASDATDRSVRSKIPQPDFVLNNCVNGEVILSEGSLGVLTEIVDSFGVSVVNHPTKAVQTTRDVSVKRLDQLAGVRVPKTLRFSSIGKTRETLVHEIENRYDYPLITRTVTLQQGKGMNKMDSREDLIAVLSAKDCPEDFFVTEYVETRQGNEFFRKIRAAVVRDEIVIVRVDYGTHWNIHGRKTEKRMQFYLENAYLMEEEKRICKDPEAGLGQLAIQSLRAIRDRIPMDVFGIDFAVNADGVVFFFEANATMNLFSTARKEVPNPKEAEARLKQAFQRYFTSLIARR